MPVWNGRLPHGVADRFGIEAARHTALRRLFHTVFLSWGYQEVIPPTFEYADTQATQVGPRLLEEMYRFVDREGYTLALRADLTVATARIVGTRLVDQPLPLRLFYIGHVFRHEEPRLGRQREFTQAGVELIGSASVAADAEVIAVGIAALQAVGLSRFQVNIGHSRWLRALLVGQNLPPNLINRLALALSRKDRAMLGDLLASLTLPGAIMRAIAETPHLSGRRPVLDRALALAGGSEARAVVQHLAELDALLQRRGLADFVAYDLAETKGIDYYTGVTFEGFVPGIGMPVCSGGRYDDLLAHFGRPLPAVGLAVELERLLLVLAEDALPGVRLTPDVVAAYPPHPAAVALLAQARQAGLWVDEDVEQRSDEELLAYAASRQAAEVWLWEGDDNLRVVKGDVVQRLSLREMALPQRSAQPLPMERTR